MICMKILLTILFLIIPNYIFAKDYICTEEKNTGFDPSNNFKITSVKNISFPLVINFEDYDMYSEEIFMMSNVKCIYEEFNETLYCISNYGTSLAFFPEENYFAMSNLFIDTNYDDSILVSYGYCREK